ncbi:MAG: hypothetical protein ABJB76_04135 [Candidatus Nitrosocosmicus sp.]
MGIKISIDRSSRDNTSIIKIEKNNSGNSGENKMSPENESLSPYLDDLSPVKEKLSPEDVEVSSTKSIDGGDTGDTGDKFNVIDEEVDNTQAESQETDDISPENQHIPSTKSLDSGDNRDTSNTIKKENDNNTNRKEAPSSEMLEQMIEYREPLFHCKQHPKVQNIHREEIEHHILNARDHKSL